MPYNFVADGVHRKTS